MTRYRFDSKPEPIEWSEPTPPRPVYANTRSRYAEFWDALRSRPGEWAIFRRNFRGSVGCYQQNHPGFEFTLRTIYLCGNCGKEFEDQDGALICPSVCEKPFIKKEKVCWARFKPAEDEKAAND